MVGVNGRHCDADPRGLVGVGGGDMEDSGCVQLQLHLWGVGRCVELQQGHIKGVEFTPILPPGIHASFRPLTPS